MPTSDLSQFDNKLIDGLQFCAMVYALFESVRGANDGPSRLRMLLTPLEKKLLEELLPICKYVQTNYRPGRYISVRWLNGNQQYDAEIVQSGAYVTPNYYPAISHLEVTCAMHPNEYLIRELLDTNGVAFGLNGIRRLKSGEIESVPVGNSGKEFIQTYSKLVLERINQKAKINYPPNTTLIIKCVLNTVYMPDEWDTLISQVSIGLPNVRFHEIYLYDAVGQYSHTLWPSDACLKQ
jgi:hypothetical protein